MEILVWNVVLSFVTGVGLWLLKSNADEVRRLGILLSKTREENADKYVTKQDMHNDINRVLQRLDRMEEKLDAYMQERRSITN